MKKTNFLGIMLILVLTIVLFTNANSRAEIRVYDNNNQFLGILVDATIENLKLFVPSLKSIFYLRQDETWGWGFNDLIYFESTDCSGTAYAVNTSFSSAELFPWIYNLSVCRGGYFAPNFANRNTILVKSYLTVQAGSCTCSQITPSQYYIGYPLGDKLQLPFNLPISYPVRYEYVAPSVEKKTVVIPLY